MLGRLHPSVHVLRSEANGLIALTKPRNILCTPPAAGNAAGKPRLLVDAVYDEELECYHHNEAEDRLYLLHRLDAGTSGVLMLSSCQKTALAVKRLFKSRLVSKEYKALVFCTRVDVPAGGAVWRDDDLPWREKKSVPAETLLVGSRQMTPFTALLTLRPKTGFTHQLRVQCAARRMPIVGDSKHGNFALNRSYPGPKRLYLHSTSISFELSGARFSFECPLPPAFLDTTYKTRDTN